MSVTGSFELGWGGFIGYTFQLHQKALSNWKIILYLSYHVCYFLDLVKLYTQVENPVTLFSVVQSFY